jgi:hypothetical protein
VFDNILERRIEWPDDMSPGCRDLVDRLLCSDPGRRLGARGAGEVNLMALKDAAADLHTPKMICHACVPAQLQCAGQQK